MTSIVHWDIPKATNTKVWNCYFTSIYSDIKARASRAGTQDRLFKIVPQSNVPLNILNMSHKFYGNFVLIYWLENTRGSHGNSNIWKNIYESKKGGGHLKKNSPEPISVLNVSMQGTFIGKMQKQKMCFTDKNSVMCLYVNSCN